MNKFLDGKVAVTKFVNDSVISSFRAKIRDEILSKIYNRAFPLNLDKLGCVSKAYFYKVFAQVVKDDVLKDFNMQSYLYDFANWLFIDMRDYDYVSLHEWSMNILINGEYGTERKMIIDQDIYLISGTTFFNNTFFKNNIGCNVYNAIKAFAELTYPDEKVMKALYDAVEKYSLSATVEFENKPYECLKEDYTDQESFRHWLCPGRISSNLQKE